MYIDTISMGLPIVYFKGLQINFSKYDVYVVANSADPNEMEHYAAFHHGLHCLKST